MRPRGGCDLEVGWAVWPWPTESAIMPETHLLTLASVVRFLRGSRASPPAADEPGTECSVKTSSLTGEAQHRGLRIDVLD